MKLTVRRHGEQLAVCRLDAEASLPDWARQPGRLRAAIRSDDELTVVCAIAAVPEVIRHEGPFTAFEVAGPLDLALTGVLAALLAPLSAAGVSVFTLSTFDTDWVLVPSLQHPAASRALERAGHTVVTAEPPRLPEKPRFPEEPRLPEGHRIPEGLRIPGGPRTADAGAQGETDGQVDPSRAARDGTGHGRTSP